MEFYCYHLLTLAKYPSTLLRPDSMTSIYPLFQGIFIITPQAQLNPQHPLSSHTDLPSYSSFSFSSLVFWLTACLPAAARRSRSHRSYCNQSSSPGRPWSPCPHSDRARAYPGLYERKDSTGLGDRSPISALCPLLCLSSLDSALFCFPA